MLKLDNEVLSQHGEQLTPITPALAENPSASCDDIRFLDRLVELWASHRKCALEVRHQTGQLLNERFGDPTKRQKRGLGLLKQAAERLRIAVSELSRMRSFAHQFVSPDDVVQQHDRTTWSDVKALLPKLKTQKLSSATKAKQRRTNAKRSNPRCCEGLKALTQRLVQVVPNALTEKQRQAFLARLRTLADTIRTRLGIVVTVGELQGESEFSRNCATV